MMFPDPSSLLWHLGVVIPLLLLAYGRGYTIANRQRDKIQGKIARSDCEDSPKP